ncbi:transcription factor IIIB 90 kDa subunit-like [Hibiscus syriacus]|uniref:transcription factor IIIB 90 kDa subunit-like n=1 Tax=Hibiscus syriacus TaxID=106335 RepID=UPI0019210DC6|nr:transcription factor IIIB 90 kDa subunit-like [Hibiscus syriacus]XP_038998402.1 transcription factor IIIB 90 kDa subunit-like [Hibiscus syriacus]
MVFCSSCSRNVAGERLNEGVLCCNFCGKVLEEYNYATEPQFVKDSAGQSKLSGNFVKSVQDISDSRRRTLDKAFDNMNSLRIQLEIDDYSDEVVQIARRFYEIGLERNFTRGRRSELVEAACLYLACRQKRKPFLLIDFSNSISVNVYELGSVYLQLCYVLYLADTKDLPKLVDPSIFIHKFTNTLIPEGNDAVVKTARDILASMKRDWMQTGRKPSGLCGAALYISALSHGLKVSKSKIIEVVHICEATLSKRLIEFENTDAGALTMEEFTEKERELRNSSLTIKQPNTGSKETSLDEVLCRHTERKSFAYGLCNECYEEFMKVSGGLEGGSDPPAFQRAEKERLAKLSVEENSNSVSNSTIESGSEKAQNIGILEDATNKAAIDDCDNNKLPGVDGSDDGSDNFSDIDDFEVDSYLLHNEEEKHFKKIIWEEMNREYLEEQAAKEAAIEAAKEALMAKYDKCPEDLQAAQELAAAAAEVVAKSRKERRQKRAAEEKSAGPPQTAAEATRRMLVKKGLSSKINYDALEKLFDDPVGTEKPKKQKLESNLDENEEKGSEIGKAGDEYNDDGGDEEDYEDYNPEFDSQVYDYEYDGY